jgi:hypothetical protein
MNSLHSLHSLQMGRISSHLSVVIMYVAEAEALLKALIHAPGTPSAMTIGSVNAVLQVSCLCLP